MGSLPKAESGRGLSMCDNCTHKAVCSIYRATGGVKKCEHFKEERRGEWVRGVTMHREWMKCSECLHSYEPTGVFCYCPNCGADMRGEET